MRAEARDFAPGAAEIYEACHKAFQNTTHITATP